MSDSLLGRHPLRFSSPLTYDAAGSGTVSVLLVGSGEETGDTGNILLHSKN